jgi:hypothetical protein
MTATNFITTIARLGQCGRTRQGHTGKRRAPAFRARAPSIASAVPQEDQSKGTAGTGYYPAALVAIENPHTSCAPPRRTRSGHGGLLPLSLCVGLRTVWLSQEGSHGVRSATNAYASYDPLKECRSMRRR